MNLFLFLALAGVLSALPPAEAENPIQYIAAPGVTEFPDASEPGAIQYACAADAGQLARHFALRHLEFDRELVRKRPGSGFCHIYYEPTVPGFRVVPDDNTIQGLFASVDPLGFVVRRKPIGDSLDILKTVLSNLPRPIDVFVSINEQYDPSYWPAALNFHFPVTPHRIQLVRRPGTIIHPWAQDYVKLGQARGHQKLLVPRRLYEGRDQDGETFRPLLDVLKAEQFARSKLSWEGGDLQFARSPKAPDRLIMFYGVSARHYWGEGLTAGEYEYVLRTEFGADDAVDLSELGLHADFLVSILPAEDIVLVPRQIRENYALAGAAARELAQMYGDSSPPELRELIRLLADASLRKGPEKPLNLINTLRPELSRIPPRDDAELRGAVEAYLAKNCSGEPELCTGIEGARAMLRNDPELARRLADAITDEELREALAPQLLDIVEGQLPSAPKWNQEALNRVVKRIENLGFRVVRAPFASPTGGGKTWVGIGYVNLLAFDRTLFIPTFGLGEAEDQILAEFTKKLPNGYRLVPVNARFSLSLNGGVHCSFGIIRDLTGRPYPTD